MDVDALARADTMALCDAAMRVRSSLASTWLSRVLESAADHLRSASAPVATVAVRSLLADAVIKGRGDSPEAKDAPPEAAATEPAADDGEEVAAKAE